MTAQRLVVSHVDADVLDVSTYDMPATTLGRTTVRLTGGRYALAVTDWRDDIPRVGDRFDMTIVEAP